MIQRVIPIILYFSLAFMIMGYLIKIMHWPNGSQVLIGGFCFHLAVYLIYLFKYRLTDDRVIYPFGFLIFAGAVLLMQVSGYADQQVAILASIVLSIGSPIYLWFHLLQNNYMGYTSFRLLRIASGIGLSFLIIAVLFKIMHWMGADILIILSCSILAILSCLNGVYKKLPTKK